MDENSKSPSVEEDGELSNQSNDGDFSDLFVIDSAPTDAEDGVNIPVYEKKFRKVLQVETKKPENQKPERPKPPQNTCWNCGGDHSLRDCTERRNYDTINRNRQLFMSKSTPRSAKASRYHLDDEQKYPHVQPGRISRRLRRALGLQSNQLPRHIYRMRVLGYPPGWVEEARVSHSGLSLFNSDGQEVADPGFEDGEIVAEGAKDKFDIKKIIEYPGFNCPCGPDIIDETERLNSIPMTEKDSIQRMVTVWQPKAVKSYKRRRMASADTSGTPKSLTISGDKKSSLLLLDDMELDSGDAASSEEEGETDIERKDEGSDINAGSSSTLGARKRLSSQSSDASNPKRQRLADGDRSECSESNEGSKEKTEKETSEKDDFLVHEIETGSKNDSQGKSPALPMTPNTGKVTSVTLGTPVIVTSPFTHLPSSEKFAKNICDVINFENLPDSTGKYEKMSGLIKKVRNFVTKLHSDDDDN